MRLPKSKKIIGGITTAIVLCAITGIVYFVNKGDSSGPGNVVYSSHKIADKTTTEPSDYEQLIHDGVVLSTSKTAEYKTLSLKVNSAKVSNVISSPGDSKTAQEGTKYLIVNVTLTNRTNSPFDYGQDHAFSFITSNFKLIDEDSIDEIYDYNSLSGETMNPDVPYTGNIIFTIAPSMHNGYIGSINDKTGGYLGMKISF